MKLSSRYWQNCRLSFVSNQGYEYNAIASAKKFARQQIVNFSESDRERLPATFFAYLL